MVRSSVCSDVTELCPSAAGVAVARAGRDSYPASVADTAHIAQLLKSDFQLNLDLRRAPFLVAADARGAAARRDGHPGGVSHAGAGSADCRGGAGAL